MKKILESLHVSAEESRTYLELLECGSITVNDFSKRTGTACATLYDILRRLVQKGLVHENITKRVKRYQAETPEALFKLFEKHIQKLQVSQHALHEMLPSLLSLQKQELLAPRYEFFEGLERVQYAIQDFLFHRDTEFLNFWNIEVGELLGEDHFFYANKKRIDNNVTQK